MNTSRPLVAAAFLHAAVVLAADPSLTIYNQKFAVVRDTVPLDLKQGVNEVRFSDTTAHLEPDSVILRDPAGKVKLAILEQNYRNDPISPELLLSLNEGKTIDFEIQRENKTEIIQGRIIRSGYAMHSYLARQRYGRTYAATQSGLGGYDYYGSGGMQPVIEIDGKIRFGIPGIPRFPSLANDTVLKPTLEWQIEADKAAKLDAEIGYVTGGMTWEADYNVVAPADGELLDITGWVTLDNQCGKTFKNARIKLLGGEVNKLQDEDRERLISAAGGTGAGGAPTAQPIAGKAFDEYHLYTLPRPTTLRDRETKQIEFVRASGVRAPRIYVYDGAKIDWHGWRWNHKDSDYGIASNTKVWVMREFKNSQANQLGFPLPRGRVRFYRQDSDKQLEFTGENIIDHTPRNETVRIYTGNAFDIAGERRRTNWTLDSKRTQADESFEIKVRNHKTERVEVRIAEYLYRWPEWEIKEKSQPFEKMDAKTIEFRVQLQPDEEKVVTYIVHYSW
jgi:hypothetical protein